MAFPLLWSIIHRSLSDWVQDLVLVSLTSHPCTDPDAIVGGFPESYVVMQFNLKASMFLNEVIHLLVIKQTSYLELDVQSGLVGP